MDPTLKGTFDAVFSSATFHWCKQNPGGVIDAVKWLLKPGGRLAFEMGGFGNWSVPVLVFLLPASLRSVDCQSVGVRSAIHEVLRRKGVDPIPLDPWYFPNVSQYTTVRFLLCVLEWSSMSDRS